MIVFKRCLGTLGLGVALVLFVGGCQRPASNVGSRLRRGVVGTYPYSYDHVCSTVAPTLEELGFVVLHSQKDIFSASVAAVTSANRKVVVRVEPCTPETTLVRVNVGMLWYHRAARIVHEAIDARLGG